MTEAWEFRFWPGEKWNKSAVFSSHSFFVRPRPKIPFLGSETARKRLLRTCDFFFSFHINFRPLNSRGELRDEPKERPEMARPESLLAGLHAVAAFPCSSLASRLSSLVLKARNNNACSVGFCSQAS